MNQFGVVERCIGQLEKGSGSSSGWREGCLEWTAERCMGQPDAAGESSGGGREGSLERALEWCMGHPEKRGKSSCGEWCVACSGDKVISLGISNDASQPGGNKCEPESGVPGGCCSCVWKDDWEAGGSGSLSLGSLIF